MNIIKLMSLAVVFVALGCGYESNPTIKTEIVDGLTIPYPKFEKEIEIILKELREDYKSETVTLQRPYEYIIGEKLNYWIQVSFLNPEFDVENNSEEIARKIIHDLSNSSDFKDLELVFVKRKGFIITLSSSQSIFFNIKELR